SPTSFVPPMIQSTVVLYTLARRSRFSRLGGRKPRSQFDRACWVTPIRFATSPWLNPARFLRKRNRSAISIAITRLCPQSTQRGVIPEDITYCVVPLDDINVACYSRGATTQR